MIERYTLIKLHEQYATDRIRANVVAETRRALSQLPELVSLAVGVPADDSALASWDLCIVARFRTIQDVETFEKHPIHRQYVEEYLGPRLAVLKAWNFDVRSYSTPL